MINFSLSKSKFHQIVSSLTWLSYPSPRHGWFSTTFRNRLLLVSSPCCGCLLQVNLSLQYHCASPFCDFLLLTLLLVTIFFSLSLHLLVIFFFSSICFVNITSPILVVIVLSSSGLSSTCPNSFSYPCNYCQRTFTRLFASLWSSSPCLLSLSISLHLLLLQSSLCVVDITSPTLVKVIFSLSGLSSTFPDSFASPCCKRWRASNCLLNLLLSSPPRLFALSISICLSLP